MQSFTATYQFNNLTLLGAKNYYAFGSEMVGRTYSVGEYRFGFNGKEKDNSIYGSGNAYDFGARIYDGRLGRWMSVDPLQKKYPSMSPYNFVGNMPFAAIDPSGKSIEIIGTKSYRKFVKKTMFNLAFKSRTGFKMVMRAIMSKENLVIADTRGDSRYKWGGIIAFNQKTAGNDNDADNGLGDKPLPSPLDTASIRKP